MGKTVIITGASGGIGAAAARAFSEKGCAVAAIYNSSEEKAKKIISELSGEKEIYKCDITKSEQVNNTVEKILSRFGKIDVLVNNAGIAEQKMLIDVTDDEWRKMLDTDLSGAFYFTRAVLPHMIKEKNGRIINVSSMWGQTGGSCEAHYSAAKAGIIGLTKALAKEMGAAGITVNAVAPGVIKTEMLSPFSKDELDALCEEIPLGRLGTPEDVANAILFLASDGAGYITGQVLAVNGGMVI